LSQFRLGPRRSSADPASNARPRSSRGDGSTEPARLYFHASFALG